MLEGLAVCPVLEVAAIIAILERVHLHPLWCPPIAMEMTGGAFELA